VNKYPVTRGRYEVSGLSWAPREYLAETTRGGAEPLGCATKIRKSHDHCVGGLGEND